MKIIISIITVVCTFQSLHSQILKVNTKDLLGHLTNPKINSQICNQGTNNALPKITINFQTFIKYLLCEARCYQSNELYLDYFGTENLTLSQLKAHQNDTVFHPLITSLPVPKDRFLEYLESVLQVEDTLQNIVNKKQLVALANVHCISVHILNYLIFVKKHQSNQLRIYESLLFKLYHKFKLNAVIRADIVLDLLRYVNTTKSRQFLSGKRFRSSFFKHPSIIQFKSKELSNYPFAHLL